ncbi:MAG: hypothetical protein ACLRW2_11150 [Parasutterella excrementihominis]
MKQDRLSRSQRHAIGQHPALVEVMDRIVPSDDSARTGHLLARKEKENNE